MACSDDSGTRPIAIGSSRISGLSRSWCAARSVAVRSMVLLGCPGVIALFTPLDARELDHPRPLLGFVGDEPDEISGCGAVDDGPEARDPGPDAAVGESCI